MPKVNLRSCNNRLQLRWTLQGQRITLSLGLTDTPQNRVLGERKARPIEDDLAFGEYDPTLTKYKPAKVAPSPKTIDLQDCWNAYIEEHVSNLAEKTQAQYRTFTGHIEKLPTCALDKPYAVRDRLVKTCSPDLAKRLLTRINAACKWMQQREQLEQNPFEGLALVD